MLMSYKMQRHAEEPNKLDSHFHSDWYNDLDK